MCWALPSSICASPTHALTPTFPKPFSLPPARLGSCRETGSGLAWEALTQPQGQHELGSRRWVRGFPDPTEGEAGVSLGL